MMTNGNDSSVATPPLIHALGGGIGSTISLLLLFPLERVRIEMQAQASAIRHMNRRTLKRTFPVCKAKNTSIIYSEDDTFDASKSVIIDDDNELAKNSHRSNILGVEFTNYELQSEQNAQPTLLRTLYMLHTQKSLYKGSTPIALTMALSNFIFFYTLQSLKKISKHPSASLMTSTIAGVMNVLLTNPFWVANLRIVKSKVHMGILECMRDIIKNEGVKQLWNGTGASLLLVSNPAIQHYFYENWKMNILKRRMITSRSAALGDIILGLKPLEAFLIAALSKALATVATYPIQLAQVLMRLRKNEKQHHLQQDSESDENTSHSSFSNMELDNNEEKVYTGTFDCMTDLFSKGGIKALYAGMDAKLIQTVLTSALTFLTYEQLVSLLARSYLLFNKSVNNAFKHLA